MIRVTLSGKLTELLGTRHRGKTGQRMIQVSLERQLSGKTTVADRYYCCGFYVSEEEASAFRPGQPIKITLEQD